MTLALTGELGTGKTTFLQGFASALGIDEQLTSPTYALEQQYRGARGDFLHLDLYRLDQTQSEELLRSSENFSGIRCIEWSERISLERLKSTGHVIHVALEEQDQHSRRIHCTFLDAALIPGQQIDQWRKDVLLPAHIVRHCDTVADVCNTLAEDLIRRGILVRKRALHDAARIHDLLRFIDFRRGGHPENTHTDEQRSLWASLAQRFPGMHHEAACAHFLREHGFPVIATIVEVHGLELPSPDRSTIEQKLLFYADKRVLIDKVVTLEERFADFAKRYGGGKTSEEGKMWYEEAKRVERELFSEGTRI